MKVTLGSVQRLIKKQIHKTITLKNNYKGHTKPGEDDNYDTVLDCIL